jgi:hypothetical protein
MNQKTKLNLTSIEQVHFVMHHKIAFHIAKPMRNRCQYIIYLVPFHRLKKGSI